MALNNAEVAKLAGKIHLGAGHERQETAVAAALRSLLVEERRGVVLADEVGFGKTYEALAVMALLCERSREAGKGFDRVLVLCKPALLGKWQEEISCARKGKGFHQYLSGEHWPERHPVYKNLLRHVRVISRRASAEEHRGIRDDGKLQAPPGLYIVNQEVLTEKNRGSRLFLKRLYRTVWDLIIIDEAHHYARWIQPAYVFAPDGNMRNYDQGISDGKFVKILALTATPFELAPNEMVQLLALVRANPTDLALIEKGLELYVRRLDHFFGLRQRNCNDPFRLDDVECLRRLRVEDARGTGLKGAGLEQLLRRYMIRNTKVENERRYFMVNKPAGKYSADRFDKLDDLRSMLKQAPLLPFDGPDALFYLQLRELIDETVEQSRAGTGSRTFVTTDLRQGLSSYPQIERSKLLERDLDSARQLKRLVIGWSREGTRRLHPKVQALADVVDSIAAYEVEKVKQDPNRWFSKILVFNKLIGGTAPHLRTVLQRRIAPLFEGHLTQSLLDRGWGPKEAFARRVRDQMRQALGSLKKTLTIEHGKYSLVPLDFNHEHFMKYQGKHFVDAFHETLLGRSKQPLFLLRAATQSKVSDAGIAEWINSEIVRPFGEAIGHVIGYYLDDTPGEERPREELAEMAERECIMRREEYTSVGLVGRYDGENVDQREAHRRNFNDLYNPFVLLVSRVGEEGIDLQEQCRYVIHYDLEWNPAKMEQREGRVDREGWGRRDEGFIDVRFMLLKGTYEERIFHTVMQRAQWFQVLVGSKKRELGKLADEATTFSAGDPDEGAIDVTDEQGRLTAEEKKAVMMDLRPE